MKIRRWTAAPLAVALLAAACGGDAVEDDVDDTTSAAEDADSAADEMADDTGSAADQLADVGIESLTFGFVPSREADELVDSADALAVVLSEALGVPVESYVSNDYAALTEAMAAGQAQIGAFGPLGVVRAIDTAGAEFVLQSSRFGSFTYHTQYTTNDPDTYCLDDVVTETDEDGFTFSYCNGTLEASEGPVGEDAIALITADTPFAYVDPTSTSGYLIPALQMQELGVDISSFDFFAGGHTASLQAVYDGDVAVGLSFDDARGSMTDQFADIGEQVVVFAYSQEIPNDGFVVAGDLPQGVKDVIVQAMLDFAATDEGVQVLDDLYEITGLREADPADLDVVRAADEAFGDSFAG